MEPSVSNAVGVTAAPASVPEWRDVDPQTFWERIFPTHQPAVLRGVVRSWPAVAQGLESPEALARYLLSLEQGGPAPLLTADPSIKGRFFYRDDMRGANFERRLAPLSAGLQALLMHLDNQQPPAIYIESAPLPDCLPTFTKCHSLELLKPAIVPRIWIGNAVKVQTHYDYSSNIACVVAGRRRFTLFPPDQLANLYVGPWDFTLAGVPVSMVRLDAPDFERYPRFRTALLRAQVADLGPGDALFIPYAWWHHVESLTAFNVLVNYWWNEGNPPLNVADSLLHALFAIRDLPLEQRAVWRNLFDYYVFQTCGDPLGHLAPENRGLMGARGEHALRMVTGLLLRSLSGT
jgi:hypothetical protein